MRRGARFYGRRVRCGRQRERVATRCLAPPAGMRIPSGRDSASNAEGRSRSAARAASTPRSGATSSHSISRRPPAPSRASAVTSRRTSAMGCSSTSAGRPHARTIRNARSVRASRSSTCWRRSTPPSPPGRASPCVSACTPGRSSLATTARSLATRRTSRRACRALLTDDRAGLAGAGVHARGHRSVGIIGGEGTRSGVRSSRSTWSASLSGARGSVLTYRRLTWTGLEFAGARWQAYARGSRFRGER